MVHRKKRESILSWVQSAGGTGIESLKQLSDGLIYYQLINTLLDKGDESLNQISNEHLESISKIHPKEKVQETNGEPSIQVQGQKGSSSFIDTSEPESNKDIEDKISCSLNNENSLEKDNNANLNHYDSDKIPNGHENEMVVSEATPVGLKTSADSVSEISVSETSNSGHAMIINENSGRETDVNRLTFVSVENSDSNTNLYGLADLIIEQSTSKKGIFDHMAVENASDTIISDVGSKSKSIPSDEALDNNQNHSCWGISQTNNNLSTLDTVQDLELSFDKKSNISKSCYEYGDNIVSVEIRYDVIQKFINSMLGVESVELVNYKDCQKGMELEIAKVTVLLLSALVQYSLSVNNEHVMASCYGLPAEDQEEIMDCLEMFLKESQSTVTKTEFNRRLARTARPRIISDKKTSSTTPKKGKSQMRKTNSKRKRIEETESPIQRLINSPCLRKTPDSEGRLVNILRGKDEVIASLINDLEKEQFNADDMNEQNEELLLKLSQSRAEIERLKSVLQDTQNNLDTQILSYGQMEKELNSEIKRYLEQIKELKNDVDFWRDKSTADINELSDLKNSNLLKENRIQELTKQVMEVQAQLEEQLAKEQCTEKMAISISEGDMSSKEKYLNSLDLSKIEIQDRCDELQARIDSQKRDYEMKIKSLDVQLSEKENDLKILKKQLCKIEKEKKAVEKTSNLLQTEKTKLETKLQTFDQIVFPIINNLSPSQSNMKQYIEQSIQSASGSGENLPRRKSLRKGSVCDSNKIGTLWTNNEDVNVDQPTPDTPENISKKDSFKKPLSLEKLSDKGSIELLENEDMQSKSHDTNSFNALSNSTNISLYSVSEKEFKEIKSSVIQLCHVIKSKHFLKNDSFLKFSELNTELKSIREITIFLMTLVDSFTILIGVFPDLSQCIERRRCISTISEVSDTSEAKEVDNREQEKTLDNREVESENFSEISVKDSSDVIKEPISRLISDLQLTREKLSEELLSTQNLLNEEREKVKTSENNYRKLKIHLEAMIRKAQEKLTISENAKNRVMEKLRKALAENEELKEEFQKEGYEKQIYYLKEDLKSTKSENHSLRGQLKKLREQNIKLGEALDDQKRNNAGTFNPEAFKEAERLKYMNLNPRVFEETETFQYDETLDDKEEISSGFCDDEGPRISSIANISAIPSAEYINTGRSKKNFNVFCKAEDEAEMLSQSSIAEIFNESPRHREKEFRRRNTLYLPHLKSSYPLELNTTPSEDKYFIPPTPLITKPSVSRKLPSSMANDNHVSKKRKIDSWSKALARPASSGSSRCSVKNHPGYLGHKVNLPSSTPKDNRSFTEKMSQSSFLRMRKLCRPGSSKQ